MGFEPTNSRSEFRILLIVKLYFLLFWYQNLKLLLSLSDKNSTDLDAVNQIPFFDIIF